MVWEKVFNQIDYASVFFCESLSKGIFDDIIWSNLSAFLEDNISIGDFLNKNNIIVKNFDFRELNDISKKILRYKLILASSIEVDENNVNIVFNTSNRRILSHFILDDSLFQLFICTHSYGKTFDEYDIISNLYPIISDNLYKLCQDSLYKPYAEIFNKHCTVIMSAPYYPYTFHIFYVSNHIHLSKEFSGNIFTFESDESSITSILPIGVSRPSNTLFVFTLYIAPDKNTSLLHHNINPTYEKAEKEGWSMIAIEEEDKNMNPKIYVKAGKCTRKELVELLPKSFWKERSKYTYIFSNGKKVNDYFP